MNRKQTLWVASFIGTLFVLAIILADDEALAAQTLRVQVDQKGDFLLIGNTLGHECLAGTPAPIVGTVGACGMASTLNDTAPDIFWRSDEPMNGQAQANTGITVGQSRSTAILTIPPSATVTHAFLYWGANVAGGDLTATLDRPGGFSQDLTALQLYTNVNDAYQSVADITAIVQAEGSGAYRVAGVNGANLINVNNSNNYSGWWMVVFYELASDPPRNLALFDGLDYVIDGNPQNLTLTGFLVPPVFANAKLGVVSFEGDNTLTGDSFSFGPAPALSDGVNAATNFFNSSRSFLGSPVSNSGDLPQLTGSAQSMSGIDIDLVDVTSKLTGGQTSVPISATSTGDTYYLAGFVTSIPTFKPDFSTSEKSALDINGGALFPGDIVEYTIVATNNGNDTSINTILLDPLPVGVAYVPGTISISAGPNMGAKTDTAGDDQCQYIIGTRTVLCRLGTGANATDGGQMLVGDSSTVRFQVTVDMNATGTILNQATITAGGLLGAPAEGTPTDGNGVTNGQPPTPIVIEHCEADTSCMAPTPYCNIAADPNKCVECWMDMHCPAAIPTCDFATNTCTCIPSGADFCDGADNDCDGVIDNGCVDSDSDGISDMLEQQYGTNPNDADSDDDGVLDGFEPSGTNDSDGDGLINVLDADSDNDGLFDGTEMGYDCSSAATNPNANQCIPDADMGATTTHPVNPDTDNGGVPDGSEDTNRNGQIGPGEGDPNDPADDIYIMDTDGDGLSDSFEMQIGSYPNDADSDDDGVPDGQEANPAADSDGAGLINVLDADSDNDGLFDGTEMGFDCSNPDTDTSKNLCIDDADKDAPPSSPIDSDSDDGGISDGSEDTNRNGRVDPAETDPRNAADDVLNQTCGNGIQAIDEPCDDGNTNDDDGCDSNCTPTSCGNSIKTTGEACDDGNTLDGDGCSASCQLEMESGAGGNGSSSSGGGVGGASIDLPEGCACSAPGKTTTNTPFWMALLVVLGMYRRRRP